MRRGFALLAMISSLGAASLVLARPSVNAIIGDWAPGDTISIQGIGFGEKAQAGPLLWDVILNQPAYADLGNGGVAPVYTDGNCPDCPWRSRGPTVYGDDPPRVYLEGALQRVPGRPHYYVSTKGHLRSFNLVDQLSLPPGEPRQYYVNWWVRSNFAASDWGTASSKITRFIADERTSVVDHNDSYCVIWGAALAIVTGPRSTENVWEPLSLQPDRWYHMEMLCDNRGLAGSMAVRGGRVKVWRDGYALHDTTYPGINPISEMYVMGFDPSVDEAFVGDTFRWGEVYVDTTQARVVVANSQNLASATRAEIQIPFVWQPDRIDVTVNRGGFQAGEPAWLFVYDNNGLTNPTGVSLSSLGTGSLPPSQPGTPVRQ